ncbi:UDP-glucuronosyltransferase 2B31-like [Styela clava]|uniref:UDP-glucuronosyltransferase 2B31-like n=1 Tax=Styela clava TaxID=7725 RepID=UPI0019399ADF|nr:UDP-glucuronosyltransferase 2B31-like [Styela clava]
MKTATFIPKHHFRSFVPSRKPQKHRILVPLSFIVIIFTILQIPQANCTYAGPDTPSKVLIWPAEFSHWINLKILAENLVKKGMEVTVLRSSAYQDFMEETDDFNFVNFNVSRFHPGDHLQSMDHILHLLKLGNEKSSFMQTIRGLAHFWLEQLDMRQSQCNALMTNQKILNKLAEAKYDVVLADATVACGEIIAAKLGVPLVYAVRILPAEAQFQYSQTPIPISYVPMINTEFTDRMNFLQRTMNLLSYLYQTIGVELYGKIAMDPLVQKYLGPNAGYRQLMSQASLWLIRTDFAFEYPRPLMPNVKFIGGFHCKPAKPLSEELENFVNDDNYDGFIVFSMGSMVRNMHKSKANTIAAAFANLKQKVVWRYLGETPDTLGPNTKIMSWLPQNDLLGHPKCKLFVTHGGTNGIYEAIYHGVPMLGLPLLVDQFDNMVRIKGKGAGKTLDITNLNRTELQSTIVELINNKSYKENAIKLSELHKDKVMTPLESATYWIEYVIRHKGAYHLRPAAHELWWFQYHLLDVIVFLIGSLVGAIWVVKLFIRYLLRKKSDKTDEQTDNSVKDKVEEMNGNGNIASSTKVVNGHLHANGYKQKNSSLQHRKKNGIRVSDPISNGNGHLSNGFHTKLSCEYCHRRKNIQSTE